jgi:transposase InsO family protein
MRGTGRSPRFEPHGRRRRSREAARPRDQIAAGRGYPTVLRCDNGPEAACAAMAEWAGERVGLAFIPPCEPWRNGYVESFNGKVRDECLNLNLLCKP